MEGNKILRVARNEYIKWITNPKMILILVMMIFSYDYVIKELIDAASKIGKELQVFEGFIGISNSQLIIMIIPVVFVGIMGDYPRIDGNALFYIYRVGKNNWLTGQILFSILASITYLGLLFSYSIFAVIGKCYFTNIWSDVTTKYYIFVPNDYNSSVSNMITGRLYNNLTPLSATINIIGLMFLLLILVSIIMLVAFICNARLVGIILTTSLMCIGNVFAYMDNKIKWIFPTAHTVLEIHFDEIYRKPIMSIQLSYVYYIILIGILIMTAYLCIENYDFTTYVELEA